MSGVNVHLYSMYSGSKTNHALNKRHIVTICIRKGKHTVGSRSGAGEKSSSGFPSSREVIHYKSPPDIEITSHHPVGSHLLVGEEEK